MSTSYDDWYAVFDERNFQILSNSGMLQRDSDFEILFYFGNKNVMLCKVLICQRIIHSPHFLVSFHVKNNLTCTSYVVL